MKVLIVTDEEAVRFHLTAILEAERFDVVDAEIGDDLVDTIRLGPWNAVAFDTDSDICQTVRLMDRGTLSPRRRRGLWRTSHDILQNLRALGSAARPGAAALRVLLCTQGEAACLGVDALPLG